MAQQNRNQKCTGQKDDGIYQKFLKTFASLILVIFWFHNPPPFCWKKNRFSENTVWVKWEISFCLGEIFAWVPEKK